MADGAFHGPCRRDAEQRNEAREPQRHGTQRTLGPDVETNAGKPRCGVFGPGFCGGRRSSLPEEFLRRLSFGEWHRRENRAAAERTGAAAYRSLGDPAFPESA